MKFDETIEIPHNVLSYLLLDRDDFPSEEDYIVACHICLNHHNYIDNFRYLTDFNQLIKDVLNALNLTVPTSRNLNKIKQIIDDEMTIYLKGLLHKLDYSASAHLPVEIKNDFLVEKFNNMLNRKNFKTNELQDYCKENKDENLIIIAQTGMGKTEAALNWIGDNKAFYFLPLRVSINAIYKRIANDIFENKDYSNKLGLLHSNTLNVYSKDIHDEDFYLHKQLTKSYSLPLNISTVDQLLDFVYKYPSFEYKVSTLALSKIVIDEIQCYDAKLTAALVKALEILDNYDVKVNILTATFPPYLQDLYLNNPYCKNKKQRKYKRKVFVNDDIKRHKLKVKNERINVQDIIDKQNISKGKCLVICNTIKQAQKIYNELKSYYEENNIVETNLHLLHSNFIGLHRSELEKDILLCGQTNHKENCIWVATNLVEASLDIDFDYLFTEMSELSSLFQRLGRCNRKGLKPIDDYNCFVYLKTDKYLLDLMLDDAIYKLSCEAIENFDGVLLESKKLELIDTFLTTEKLKQYNSKFLRDFKDYYNELDSIVTYDYEKDDAKLRDIKNITFIPENIYYEFEDNIANWINVIKNNSHNTKEYLFAKQNLESLLLNIPKYNRSYKQNKLGPIIKEIKLSDYEIYKVISCSYSNEKGLISNKEITNNFL